MSDDEPTIIADILNFDGEHEEIPVAREVVRILRERTPKSNNGKGTLAWFRDFCAEHGLECSGQQKETGLFLVRRK